MNYHATFLFLTLITLVFVNCRVSRSRAKDELQDLISRTKEAEPEYYPDRPDHNTKVWETFYECLDRQWRSVSQLRTLSPISMTVLEGGTARMDCDLCFSPALTGRSPEWRRFGETLAFVDDTIVLDRSSGRLTMYGVLLEEAGYYQCSLGETRSRPYLLHVVPSDDALRHVRGKASPNGPWPQEDIERMVPQTDLQIRIFTEWSEWTECSQCDAVGKRLRFGACSVTAVGYAGRKTHREKRTPEYGSLFKLRKTTGNHQHSTKSLTTVRPTPDKPPNLPYVLELFEKGLPCVSPLLPEIIRKLSEVSDRKNEILESYCKPPCTEDIFVVKDVFGKIIESANNSAGVFSALQGPPPLPPLPQRTTLFIPYGKKLMVSCPGHLQYDIPYYWTVNRTQRLYNLQLNNQTDGRVSINYRQQMIFRVVEPEDSKVYVCWQHGEIAGVVRLVVFDPATVGFNHHIMLFGTVVILATFAYVFYRILVNRKLAANA